MGYAQKWVRTVRSYETLKSGASHKRFDESADWLNDFSKHGDSDSIVFGLATSLLCIFDICWVSTAVVLVKNDALLLVPTGIVLELGFPQCFFNKSLIKCKKIVSHVMQY